VSLFKYLQYAEELPDYYVFYEGMPIIDYTFLGEHEVVYEEPSGGIKKRRLFAVGTPLFRERLVPRDPQVLEAIGGLKLVDELDIGYHESEVAHGYSRWSVLEDFEIQEALVKDNVDEGEVIDAGRPITGGESFVVRTVPGRPLILVLRTNGTMGYVIKRNSSKGASFGVYEGRDFKYQLFVDDRPVREFTVGVYDEGWKELSLTIPKEYIRQNTCEITLDGTFHSFHYWFYQ
jgi:hypothetical protein